MLTIFPFAFSSFFCIARTRYFHETRRRFCSHCGGATASVTGELVTARSPSGWPEANSLHPNENHLHPNVRVRFQSSSADVCAKCMKRECFKNDVLKVRMREREARSGGIKGRKQVEIGSGWWGGGREKSDGRGSVRELRINQGGTEWRTKRGRR